MTQNEVPRWLNRARKTEALGQTGRHYAVNEYDRERYQRLIDIASEMISTQSDLQYQEVVELLNRQTGYATPRVDVRGVVFVDGKLLMVRERMDGRGTMPGGWMQGGGRGKGIQELLGVEVRRLYICVPVQILRA